MNKLLLCKIRHPHCYLVNNVQHLPPHVLNLSIENAAQEEVDAVGERRRVITLLDLHNNAIELTDYSHCLLGLT